jgi:2-polyprenyl-3-methyl-5-hydroxy-6-metoxy-1,4-benzoquinol methylase/uncharacterized protein YbaR (Trm112 family)|tara:strand:+ start:1947 stop:3047 length:1101 start_codon:yes stop_codon:yes gene_type:complete
MLYRLLDFLECPHCFSKFSLVPLNENNVPTSNSDIDLGLLVCENRDVFPLVRGIPRLFTGSNIVFYEDLRSCLTDISTNIKEIIHQSITKNEQHLDQKFLHTQKSFSSQWSSIESKDSAWGRDVSQRKDLFMDQFSISPNDLIGKTILDAGCGHGEVELALKDMDSEIFAVDLSFSVDYVKNQIEKKESNSNAVFHFIQANIHQLPIKKHNFDLVHSAGVLHHTPDTHKGFTIISQRTKPGGRCFIEVYSTDHMNMIEKFILIIHNFIRIFSTKLPHSILHSICFTLSPILWCFFEVVNLIMKENKYNRRTLKEVELSLFDGLSPKFRFQHTTEEVIDWFSSNHYEDIQKTFHNHNGIGIVGTLNI